MNDILQFPEGFLWGTATSAHQVEGNNTNNQWWAWEQQPGHIWHDDRSGLACNWWADADADFDRARAMGQNTHRLSVEWSRIEPREGEFDADAIARYRQMLQGLRARGMRPMVTLHHFTDPLWFTARGGWEVSDSVRAFSRFVEHAVRELRDLVDLWCPVNEPGVIALLGYLIGPFPPDRRDPLMAIRVLNNLLRAHAAAYRIVHRLDGRARVGFVHNVRVFDPARPESRLDRALARVHDVVVNRRIFEAVITGHLGFPLSLDLFGPYGRLVDSTDFLGVNYYTRDLVQFDPARPTAFFARRFPTPGAECSDCGRAGTYGEVYPEGLYKVLRDAAGYRKPILITESGLPDADDDQRPRFLLTHLAAVWRALRDGVPVEGYYHWSLIDNFEWADGWSLRFGLIEVDPATQARRMRRSGELFAEIARANAITRDMVTRYAPEAMQDVFHD